MNWLTALWGRLPLKMQQRAKAFAAAIGAAAGAYLVQALVHGDPWTLRGLEDATGAAALAFLGAHQAVNSLTARQAAAGPRLPTGKRPARRDPRDLQLHRYLTSTALPPVPPGPVGVTAQTTAWGTLGNASYGDCVWAGADHETMVWTAGAGTEAIFTDANALADYSAVTGFNPSNPSSDRGTDVRNAYGYRIATGVVDAHGARHKLAAYLAVDLDPDHLKLAVYLFGAVGLGIAFPDSAMTQFNQGQPWDVVPGTPTPTDGHYVPLVGYDPAKNLWYVVTWGRLQPVTTAFLIAYVDECYALLSAEEKPPAGLDWAALQADLAAVNGTVTPPTPTPAGGVTVTDPALVAKITAIATKDHEDPVTYLTNRLRSLWHVS